MTGNDPPAPAAFVAWVPGNLSAAVPEDLNALNAPHQPFLDQQIPKQPTTEGGTWKGVRFLAAGGSSLVGMWEHDGQGPNPPRNRRAAVKEMSSPFYNLRLEGMLMQRLGKGISPHIVRLVSQPVGVNPARENLGAEWNRVVKRLIIEYCPQGSLWSLLNRREIQ